MGKELQMARQEEIRRPMLLASIGTRRVESETLHRTSGEEEAGHIEGEAGQAPAFTPKKGKGSGKAKGTYVSFNRTGRRGRDDKNRRQARGPEGRDRTSGRSAQLLGIIWPDAHCADSPTGGHHMLEVANIDKGLMFRCKYCLIHKWHFTDSYVMSAPMVTLGKDKGYCKILDGHRKARAVVAELQDAMRLKDKMDRAKFIMLLDFILEGK